MRTGMLGFGGRIDRLHFTAATLVVALVASVAALTALLSLLPDDPAAANAAISDPGTRLTATVLLIVLPAAMWAGLSLIVQRARDIGWRPAYVLAALAGAGAIDLAAVEAPVSIGLVAAAALVGALLVWPSATAEA